MKHNKLLSRFWLTPIYFASRGADLSFFAVWLTGYHAALGNSQKLDITSKAPYFRKILFWPLGLDYEDLNPAILVSKMLWSVGLTRVDVFDSVHLLGENAYLCNILKLYAFIVFHFSEPRDLGKSIFPSEQFRRFAIMLGGFLMQHFLIVIRL